MVSSNHLEPGETGGVKATLDTANRNGPIEKHITIYTNDRTNPVLSLAVIADIVARP